jgi:hypothetical protein
MALAILRKIMQLLKKTDIKIWSDRLIAIHEKAGKIIVLFVPFFEGISPHVGLYIFALGVVNWVVHACLMHYAQVAFFEWTPGFRTIRPDYNEYFVHYAIFVLSIVFVMVCRLLLSHAPRLQEAWRRIAEQAPGAVVFLSLCSIWFTSFNLSRLCFVLTTIIFLPQFIALIFGDKDSAAVLSINAFGQFIKRNSTLFLLIPLIISCGVAVRAWYPVQIVNDFMQFPESISQPVTSSAMHESSPLPVMRSQVEDCLEDYDHKISLDFNASHVGVDLEMAAYIKETSRLYDVPEPILTAILLNQSSAEKSVAPHCSLDNISWTNLNRLREPLRAANAWQSQTGRLFYHHAYLYVPAAHFLKYGLKSPIPYLYGLGNTTFYSLLMSVTSPTLTSYFNTFPIAQGMGIFAILLLVFYATRNVLAVYAAMATILLFLFQSGFEPVQMAPGFNPLRYAGLAFQTASIFYLFRGLDSLRPAGMLLALAASIFWNTEFAFLGFVGQALALFVPQMKMPLGRRFAWLAAMAAILAVANVILNDLTHGYLHTIQAGLFGIALPPLSVKILAALCLCMAIICALLVYGITKFQGNEKTARVVILPILALVMIKYFYTPSPIHLYFCMMFVAPVLLICFPWPSRHEKAVLTERRSGHIYALVAMMVVLCLVRSISYYWEAYQRQENMIDPFVKNSWSSLGERFETTTPAEPVTSRMEAIKSEMRVDDTVLFLSPLDYLMSFYVNPEHYCGHFEITSNLTTYDDVQRVVDCVRNSPKVLVVYDDAVEIPCPDLWLKYDDKNVCALKSMRMMMLKSVMDALLSDLVLAKKTGGLSFYRHAVP